MGLETATYISGLNASNPINATDVVGEGDDHLRLIKSTLLNTFPNITGAMTLTHTQLNNAAIKTEANIFTANQRLSSTQPTLFFQETDASVDEGRWKFAVANGDFYLQTVNDADAGPQTALVITRTGTSVDAFRINVASGEPALIATANAATALYYDGIMRFETQSDGARVRGAGTTDPTTGGSHDCELNLWNETPALLAQIGFPNAGSMEIRNRVHGSSVIIAAEDTGGTLRQLADFSSNAGVTLRYLGADRFLTQANGQIYLRADTSPGIGSAQTVGIVLQDDAGANLSLIGYGTSTDLSIQNFNHGGAVGLYAENNAGSLKTLMTGDPDSQAVLFHAGVAAIGTNAEGLSVYDTSGDDPLIGLYQDDASTRNGYIYAGSAQGVKLVNEVHGLPVTLASEDNSGSPRNLFVGDPDGLTEIIGRTQVSLTATTGGGGDLLGNSLHVTTNNLAADEIGYKGTPQQAKAANYTLVLNDAGKSVYLTGSTASQSITIPANASVAFPIGTVIEIISEATVNWSISITTDTLLLLGSGSTGTRTLSQYGKAVIQKVTATKWVISGINLA